MFASQLVSRGRAMSSLHSASPAVFRADSAISTSKTLQRLGSRLKPEPRLSTLHPEALLLIGGLADLRFEALRFPLQGCKALFGLGGAVARVPSQLSRCIAWRRFASR